MFGMTERSFRAHWIPQCGPGNKAVDGALYASHTPCPSRLQHPWISYSTAATKKREKKPLRNFIAKTLLVTNFKFQSQNRMIRNNNYSTKISIFICNVTKHIFIMSLAVLTLNSVAQRLNRYHEVIHYRFTSTSVYESTVIKLRGYISITYTHDSI